MNADRKERMGRYSTKPYKNIESLCINSRPNQKLGWIFFAKVEDFTFAPSTFPAPPLHHTESLSSWPKAGLAHHGQGQEWGSSLKPLHAGHFSKGAEARGSGVEHGDGETLIQHQSHSKRVKTKADGEWGYSQPLLKAWSMWVPGWSRLWFMTERDKSDTVTLKPNILPISMKLAQNHRINGL